MKSIEPAVARDVLLLSLAAGSADAAGWVALGHVFTSNMTGNVVLLGIALGQGHLADAARSLYVLTIYMLGAALGARISRDIADEDWPRLAARLVGVEKIVLLAFAIGWTALPRANLPADGVLLALLALAMSLQSVAWSRLRAPGVGTTAVTSTITALVTGLATLPGGFEASGPRLRFQSGVLGLYLLGAAASGLLILQLPWLAGWIPIAAALFVARGKPGD